MRAGMALRIALLASVAGLGAYAQVAQNVNVGFDFKAGEKAFPAGQYRLTVEGTTASRYVVLRGKAADTRLPVITLLGGGARSAKVKLVFDSFKGENHLSEVWLPDSDGLLVATTKQQHKHQAVE